MLKDKVNDNNNISDNLLKMFPFMKFFFDRFSWLAQFINFGIVGVSNMLVAYSVYAILVYFNVHPQIANIFSVLVSILNAYVWNRFWVFSQTATKKVTAPIRFIVVYGGNLLLGMVLLYLYIDVWHLNKYIAPFISMPVTIPLNYILNRFWVFKE